MSDGSSELSHYCEPIRVGQFHLHLTVAPLGLAQFGFGPFALGQIEHEGDTLVPAFAETGRAYQNRHSAAVSPEIFLFKRLDCPGVL